MLLSEAFHNYLDELARTEIRVLCRSRPAFQVCGGRTEDEGEENDALYQRLRGGNRMQRQTANTTQPDQKQAAPAAPLHEHPLTQIRRALGTRAGWRSIQAKLTVSQPGDQYEQEADRVADQVMRMPDHTAPATVRPGDLPQISRLQRMCAQCEEEEIQRQPMAEEMKG